MKRKWTNEERVAYARRTWRQAWADGVELDIEGVETPQAFGSEFALRAQAMEVRAGSSAARSGRSAPNEAMHLPSREIVTRSLESHKAKSMRHKRPPPGALKPEGGK